MRAREFLAEGGNVQIGDQEAQAMQLELRQRMVPVLAQLLASINSAYHQITGHPLWKPALLKSQKFLSGSSLHWFNLEIPDEAFRKAKKTKAGDIDTQVDETNKDKIKQFLDAIGGKTIGPAKFVGYKESAEQYITLWNLTEFGQNIQIDLEQVQYDKGEPTEWSRFSHSSAWEDLEQGVKGVFHKYLLRALSTPSLRDVVVLSGKRETPKKVKTTDLAFAVTKGLRFKLAPVMDNGQQRELDGLKVFKEIPTKDSVYETNLLAMCRIFFGPEFNPADVEKYWSFVGTLDLVKKYFTPEQQSNVILGFAYTLFGPQGQELYRGDPARDNEEKTAALDHMIKALGVNYDQAAVKQLHTSYYSK